MAAYGAAPPPRTPSRARPGVQPADPLQAELVELLERVECRLVGGGDDPSLDEVDRGLGDRLVAGAADPGGDDRRPVVLGEAPVFAVDERHVDRGAVRRRGGVVRHEHPGDPAEVLERAGLPLLPGPLPHVGEALRPEAVRVRQRHDDHVDLRLGPGEPVGDGGRVPGPVDVGLRAGLVGEPPLGARLLRGLGEHLAEGLVRVGRFPRGRGGLAVLHPEHLDRELAVPLLALDQRRHVRRQVGALRRPLRRRRDHPVDLGVAHRRDAVERQVVLADRPRARRHVALARMQRRGDLGLRDPSLREHQEDLLSLGHGHQPLSVFAAPALRAPSRRILGAVPCKPIRGTVRPDCRYQKWLTRVTRWGYYSICASFASLALSPQITIAMVKAIPTEFG